jgi:branched-chain amino acid transport system substrate-binding protein
MKQRVVKGLLLAVVACAVFFFGAARPGLAEEPIKIGAVFSITGWGGFMGQPMKDAMVAMVEDFNKKGGVKGRKAEIYVEDDQSNPTSAVIATTKLVKDRKVSVLVGPSITDSGLAMIPIAEQEQVPFVISGPVIAPLKKWVFHGLANDLVNSGAVLEFAVKGLGAKKIGVIHDTANFGMVGMKAFTTECAKYPTCSIVIEEKFETTDTNVIPQLSKIKAANPDVLLVQTPGGQAGMIAKNYRQLGMKMKVVGPPGSASPEFLRIAGTAPEENWYQLAGKIMVADKLSPDDPWRKNLYEPFKKVMADKYGKTKQLNVFSGVAHDAIKIVLEAIKTAGTDDRAAIRDALETIKLEAFNGPYSCSPTDHKGISIFNGPVVVVKNGEFVPYKK